LEFVAQAPDAVPISRLGFRYSSRTGTPPTYKIALQGVNGSGNPDGTIKGGESPASATFTPPADDTWSGTWQWISLDNSYTPSQGELLAVVIAYDSGTIDASNYSTFTTALNNISNRPGRPYGITNDNGSRSRIATPPIFGAGGTSSSWGTPVKAIYTTQISVSTSPDEQAVAFSLPSGSCNTYQVAGVRVGGTNAAAGKTYLVTLYSETTPLQQITVDSDQVSNVGTYTLMQFTFSETTLSTLSCGTTYRIGLAPQESSANFSLHGLTVGAATDLSAYPGGTAWYLSTRTDSGNWTDDQTTRPLAELIIANLTEASGGGTRSYATVQ
jgi:hypothetical protein